MRITYCNPQYFILNHLCDVQEGLLLLIYVVFRFCSSVIIGTAIGVTVGNAALWLSARTCDHVDIFMGI